MGQPERSATICNTLSARNKCTLATRSLLVLRAVWRQQHAMYVIWAIFQCQLYKHEKHIVREIIAVSLKTSISPYTQWHKRWPRAICKPEVERTVKSLSETSVPSGGKIYGPTWQSPFFGNHATEYSLRGTLMRFRWWNVFNGMCRMGRWSIRCWIDVNGSIPIWWSYEWKWSLHFRSHWPCDLWPLDLKFAPLVTLQSDVSTKLEVSISFRFRENRSHWTDGRKDGVQHLMRPPSLPREGSNKKFSYRRGTACQWHSTL